MALSFASLLAQAYTLLYAHTSSMSRITSKAAVERQPTAVHPCQRHHIAVGKVWKNAHPQPAGGGSGGSEDMWASRVCHCISKMLCLLV